MRVSWKKKCDKLFEHIVFFELKSQFIYNSRKKTLSKLIKIDISLDIYLYIFSVSFFKQLFNKNAGRKVSEKIWLHFLESLDSFTTHGLFFVFKAKFRPIRLVWLVLTIVAAALSIYFIIYTIEDYSSFRVTTEVRFVDSKEFEFPKVIFCNKNKISSNYSFLNYRKMAISDES